MKFRLVKFSKSWWRLTHPDGFWVGPGLGMFRSAADAMDWLHAQR